MVAGGNSKDESFLANVDIIDLDSGHWRATTNLCVPRHRHSITELNDKIYCMGGNCLSSVEVFDKDIENWREIKSMKETRADFGAATCGNRIFATGGFSGKYLNTVEAYGPRTGVWKYLSAMKEERSKFGVAVIGNCMFTVGGRSETMSACTHRVEILDIRTNSWRYGSSLTFAKDF